MHSFATTDYLGIRHDPAFHRMIVEGLERHGVHYGGSRRSNACPGVFDEAERMLEDLTGAEAALIVSSGTVAAAVTIDHLVDQGYRPFASASAHPSLTDGHHGVDDLDGAGGVVAVAAKVDRPAFLFDTVDPVRVRELDLGRLASLGPDAAVVLDDSHGLGLRGEGGGAYRQANAEVAGRLIVVASLGKALCLPAGVILSDRATIDAIAGSRRFGGSSPPSLPHVDALVGAGPLYAERRGRLEDRIAAFTAGVPDERRASLFSWLPDYPVFRIDDEDLATHLADRGFCFSRFRYPSPSDPVVSRLVLSAGHSPDEIDRLVAAVASFGGPDPN